MVGVGSRAAIGFRHCWQNEVVCYFSDMNNDRAVLL